MNLRRFKLFLIILIACNSVLAAESPIDKLRNYLDSTRTLTAHFMQLAIDEQGAPDRRSQGMFFLSKPGKFRWSYTTPYVQEIISDGFKVWFYEADLDQVTIKRIDSTIGSTPALLLSGEVKLEENFKLEDQGTDGGMDWIKLIPKKEESDFKYILIGMDGENLGGMELSDNFGQLTRIYFSDVKVNTALDPKTFLFVAPSGVDVFEE